MPLFKVQREALAAIARNRHPGSHVAGGTVINADGFRFSKDIDIFHDLSNDDDRFYRLKATVEMDAKSLSDAGFEVEWKAEHPELYRAVIRKDGETTLLEWVIDSDFRFFEAVRDDVFGYTLHMFDLATNKVLAAASRKEPRDVVDLLHIHRHHFPIAAAIWAAPAKDPGYSPESLIEALKRNAVYRQDDFDRLMSDKAIDAREVSMALKVIFHQAENFVASMPSGYDGLLFLENGAVVQPDPSRLEDYETVAARRQAHWPGSPEIASDMISSKPKT